MKFVKGIIRRIVGASNIERFNKIRTMYYNYREDFILYYRHSNVFTVDNIDKEEAQLILDYHSLEKGMLFSDLRLGFAKFRVIRLNRNLALQSMKENISRSQIRIAYKIMCKYYELHKEENFDISNFFTERQYLEYKSLLKADYDEDFKGILEYSYELFYKDVNAPFEIFAKSRKSIRDFTGDKIDREIIEKAVRLAITAPSVCNRQASKVYLLEDKSRIDAVLHIQGGFAGYTEKVQQLLILTNDRDYYYTIGERNQFYIDGGIFLMNLLYSLHYYNIANCPANWGKLVAEEREVSKFIQIPKGEKIICMIPIGKAPISFRTTLSYRRDLKEVFKIL